MNKAVFFFLITCFGLAGCKKEADLPGPEELDFEGQYSFSANAHKLSGNDNAIYPILMENVVDPFGNYFELQLEYFSNDQYRYTSSSLQKNTGSDQFNFFVYAGDANTGDIVPNLWTIAELDSIFQENKVLSFGEAFGQVGVGLVDPLLTEGKIYESNHADNSASVVRIEKIEDMRIYFPDTKWVKKVTFSFNCKLQNEVNSQSLPGIELFDCHATLLFKPRVIN